MNFAKETAVRIWRKFFPTLRDISRLKNQVSRLNQIILNQTEEIACLKNHAWRDSLSGLLTRHGMKETLHALVSSLNRRKDTDASEYVVIIIDLDDFGEINNAHGHDIGDKAIVAVSDAIMKCFRDSDVCGRWGGDEFVVILPNTLISVVDDLLKRFNEKLALITESQPFKGLRMKKKITASIGATQINVEASDEVALWARVEGAITTADAAMYVGKKNGKAQIIITD